jgi:inner membrane transporter RhtA
MAQVEPSLAAAPAAKAQTAAIPPWLFILFAVLSTQFGAAVAKQLFDTVGTNGVVFLRTLISGIAFFLLWRPQVRGYRKQDYIIITAYGVTIAEMMLTFYAAINRIPLGIAVTIAFAGPLGVAVIGSRRLIDVAWVAVAAVGILLLTPLTASTLDLVGLFMALLSAIGWAVFILLSRRVTERFHENAGLTIAMCIAAVASLPFGLGGAVNALASMPLLALSVAVALLSSTIPFALEFQALKQVSARVYGLLVSLEPVVATIMGLIVLGEALGVREIAGIALVTIAAAATTRSAPKTVSVLHE